MPIDFRMLSRASFVVSQHVSLSLVLIVGLSGVTESFAANASINFSVKMPERSILYCYNAVKRAGRSVPIESIEVCRGYERHFNRNRDYTGGSVRIPASQKTISTRNAEPKRINGEMFYEISSP